MDINKLNIATNDALNCVWLNSKQVSLSLSSSAIILPGDLLVILVVEDNLVKGAAGQGVQCMNLMFGLDETTGLRQVPILP